jgi:(1->4)-alpha-D-glucan 1-alpha-D-glucosylmutase
VSATEQAKALLDRVSAAQSAEQRLPESTYRWQLHERFTFRDAARLVPYLHGLGITDCYASPYLKARPGSKHGYDITDHRVLNPEIGNEEDYETWVRELQGHGMGQLLDIVPNHMATGEQNPWWTDVLENGPGSRYAAYFDIEWHPTTPALNEKVCLPVLGEPYGKVLESGQVVLHYEAGAFWVSYFDKRFPICPATTQRVLRHRLPDLEKTLGAESPEFIEYQSILTALSHLPPRSETDAQKVAERQREKEVIKRRLTTLTEQSPAMDMFLRQNAVLFNGDTAEPHSFDLLDDLLNEQAYRLAFWRVAADEINYRRFFDINELAALSMEKAEVFADTHELIFRLLREGKVTGLRIDHPDGLYDPRQYLVRLQQQYILERARLVFANDAAFQGQQWSALEGPLLEAIGQEVGVKPESPLYRPLYVVVEKVLQGDETLPPDWPVYGTTGYEFMNALTRLFVDHANGSLFGRIYQRWTGQLTPLPDLVYQKKFLILQVSLSSELHVLAYQLDRLSEKDRWSRDFTLNSLRHALREIIACFPVYRSYISADGVHSDDAEAVENAVALAKRKNPAISESLFDFVRDMVLLRYPEAYRRRDKVAQRRFVGKFQQVTGPVMAKGFEDTTLYVYNRLLALNEVGGDPARFGASPEALHYFNEERQQYWPHGLSATSTHDTKRSEDVRARLSVLSELPHSWHEKLAAWGRLNRRHRLLYRGADAPDRNDEYLLYQTLLGAWPIEPCPAPEFARFVVRIQQYMQKAIHEAKVHTSWINPNQEYDDAVTSFVADILDETKNARFLEGFRAFQRLIHHWGLFTSLAQALLKLASPGVPDIYQGTEIWDFSLVDPDNRRQVDYERRQRMLKELDQQAAAAGAQLPALARAMTVAKDDGRIKLYVTSRGLRCRRDHSGLLSRGDYLPVETAGSRGQHVCAFLRLREGLMALAAVPRLLAGLIPREGALPLGHEIWQDTRLILPARAAGQRWHNLFTGTVITTGAQLGRPSLPVGDVFADFPVALLLADQAKS